jgi:hypothetical protein
MSQLVAIIEHMFEQTATEQAAGDSGPAPIPPAAQDVSTSPDVPVSARLWQETMPGPEMIAALAQVSLQTCTDSELLDVLTGWQRVEAWVAAQQTRALARTHERLLETAAREETDVEGRTCWTAVYRQAETEISTALRWTSRFASHQLQTAQTLTDTLPAVLDALEAGQLTYRHADMICEETATLTDAQARKAVDKVLPGASTTTVGGLRRRLRKACLQIDPEAGKEKAKKATTERSLTIRPLPDGQALLEAVGPAASVLAMFRILDDAARQAPKNDPRTRTARRFDTLVDFVLAGPLYADGCPPQQPTIPVLAQVTMDLPTLLGLRNNPAELHGYGPLPANLARALATDADWQRFIQDPITGAPHDLGRTRRHPTAGLRRWIIARDKTCLFPECYRPAHHCEPDHNPDWQHHGPTNKDTLTQLCPKHHKVRHHGWTYQRHPDRITWTSPHGRSYQRHFTEADLVSTEDDCASADADRGTANDRRPHLDDTFEDYIDEPCDDDQDIAPFLPTPRPGQPDQPIPASVVDAFHLDEEIPNWPDDANGDPLEAEPLTFEEESRLFEIDFRRRYGEELFRADSLIGQALLSKASNGRQTSYAYATDPPPF